MVWSNVHVCLPNVFTSAGQLLRFHSSSNLVPASVAMVSADVVPDWVAMVADCSFDLSVAPAAAAAAGFFPVPIFDHVLKSTQTRQGLPSFIGICSPVVGSTYTVSLAIVLMKFEINKEQNESVL